MGALSGNSFVAGRLTVAAANKRYLPKFFGVIGRLGPEKKHKEPREDEREVEEDSTPQFDAPLYVLLTNCCFQLLTLSK
jgi:L-type amino acid transporter 9